MSRRQWAAAHPAGADRLRGPAGKPLADYDRRLTVGAARSCGAHVAPWCGSFWTHEQHALGQRVEHASEFQIRAAAPRLARCVLTRDTRRNSVPSAGPRAQRAADEVARQWVDRVGDVGVLIARDLRLRPQGDLVRHVGCDTAAAARPRRRACTTVPPQPVVLATQVRGVGRLVLERREDLAGKAVVADRFAPRARQVLVARVPRPRRINVNARACAYARNAIVIRRPSVGLGDDRRRVIGNQDFDNAAEKVPRRFARFDRSNTSRSCVSLTAPVSTRSPETSIWSSGCAPGDPAAHRADRGGESHLRERDNPRRAEISGIELADRRLPGPCKRTGFLPCPTGRRRGARACRRSGTRSPGCLHDGRLDFSRGGDGLHDVRHRSRLAPGPYHSVVLRIPMTRSCIRSPAR